MSTYTQKNHTAPLARSNSLLGTIKNIVTAPFTWFAGSDDEFEDAGGKRRRLPAPSEDAQMDDESLPSRAKRMRVASPDREPQPYLDPPASAFAQPRRTSVHSLPGATRDVTRSPRKMLHLPSSSAHLPRNRRTLSPLPSGSHLKPQPVTRTMSLDPPSHSSFSSRVQAAPTIPDLQPEPNRVANSVPASREMSMSPRHLRVRSSLTPQPSGSGFGPVVPPRRGRGPDDPPPLASLVSNPMFVKPPPTAQKQGPVELQKQLTLGSLLDSQRSSRAPTHQSSILFGTGSMTDVSARHLWPVNKAEIALHELEVYKTPLLPTRLKGSTAVPDMFLHKEKKHITLMTDDRPVKPRLGTKSKGKERAKKKEKEREIMNGTKPYAGEGGMKKWLARRKKEEEDAKEKERADAMEDERVEELKRKEAETEKKKRVEELKVPPPPPSAPAFEPRVPREGPLTSSLRVGRTRIGRNHIDRPVSRRAKFSAAFEDEDEEMEESREAEQRALEEAAKKAPAFELPAGFTFAKETTVTHDSTNAKEPPIASLPFSLTKPAPAPISAPVAVPQPQPPTPAPPKISLIPPTPEVVKLAPEAPVTTAPAGMPNFFSSSSVFAKSTINTTPSPSFVSMAEPLKPALAPEPQAPKAIDPTPSPFAAPSLPTSIFATPPDSASSTLRAPTLSKEAEKPTTATPTPATPFTFGAPPKPVESAPATGPSLPKQPPAAEPTKPASANGSLFTFGPPAPAPAPAPASVAPVATVETSKSAFAFGQPASLTSSTPAAPPVTAPPTADAPKSLFGTPPPVNSFSFGQPPSTAPAEEKPVTSPFTFGTSSVEEKKPSTGFSFGSSSTPAVAPAVTAAFSFGATPNGTTTADVSTKPFTFGATTPARPVTPPKTVQEVTMDESPARDMALNGNGNNGKAPERPTLNFSFTPPSGSVLFAQSPATTTAPFSFGAPGATVNPFAKEEKKETKPAVIFSDFGQPASTGFSFNQKPPESPATTTSAPGFQFTQPSPSVAPPSPFTFGPTSATPFSQPSAASAPSSPSTFNRPASFAFGPPAATQQTATPFTFGTGSQPASPATGNTTLPTGATGNTPFTFGAGMTSTTAPAVGFGAAASAVAPTGGSLFTMGSAPTGEGAGGRRIKGLPRRGVRR